MKIVLISIQIFQVFENYMVDHMHESRHYTLSLHDTAGNEGYDGLRPLSYPGTHVFLLCYSIASRVSFGNVTDKVRDRGVSMTTAVEYTVIYISQELKG